MARPASSLHTMKRARAQVSPFPSLGDREIRANLRQFLSEWHAEDASTLIREELPLRGGRQRADLVVVNGSLTGIEIKSDRDDLSRLPGQVIAYSAVMDYSIIVVGRGLREQSAAAVPGWWGIIEATADAVGGVQFAVLREPQRNPQQTSQGLVELLWREELLALLDRRGAARGLRSAGCRRLWGRVVELYSVEQLGSELRSALKRRARAEVAREPS